MMNNHHLDVFWPSSLEPCPQRQRDQGVEWREYGEYKEGEEEEGVKEEAVMVLILEEEGVMDERVNEERVTWYYWIASDRSIERIRVIKGD